MKRELQGRYEIVTTTGEKVRAFVPAPLPPVPPLQWSASLRARFDEALRGLQAAGFRPPLLHLANSSALIAQPATRFNLVRSGLALYGIRPCRAAAKVNLRPALALKSHVAHLKRVHRGREHLIIEKGGIAVAALIGMREYDEFLRWRGQQELRSLGQAMAGRAQIAGVDEETLAAALEEDRRAVYASRYQGQSEP